MSLLTEMTTELLENEVTSEELDNTIRQVMKTMIRTMEIMFEEVEKSSLPQSVKGRILSGEIDLLNKK